MQDQHSDRQVTFIRAKIDVSERFRNCRSAQARRYVYDQHNDRLVEYIPELDTSSEIEDDVDTKSDGISRLDGVARGAYLGDAGR